MNAKQKNAAPISPDPDAVPEITDAGIEGADRCRGDKPARRGRPKMANSRQLLSLRLPPQVIERWRASGPGWLRRMADVVEKAAPKPRRPAD